MSSAELLPPLPLLSPARRAIRSRTSDKLLPWPELLSRRWVTTRKGQLATGIVAGRSFSKVDVRRALLPYRLHVSVFSWNVLADCKQRHEADKGHFSGGVCKGKIALTRARTICLQWGQRKWALLDSVLAPDADILLLQEVDHWDDFWIPELSAAGYAGVRTLKDPANLSGDAVAVFYRVSNFALLANDDQTNFVALALLEHKETGQRILAASVHLVPKKTPVAELKRRDQVIQLLRVIGDFRSGNDAAQETVPLVLAGDLNTVSRPDSAIGEPLAYMDLVNSGLKSVYADPSATHAMASGESEPPFTCWTLRGENEDDEVKRTIDFIFVDPKFEALQLLRLPHEEEVPHERPPTFSCPSDHFALGVVLSLPDSEGVNASSSVASKWSDFCGTFSLCVPCCMVGAHVADDSCERTLKLSL